MEVKEMVLEGAIGIMTGLNPFIIQERLRAYMHPTEKKVEAA
jgi:flagellar motor component MotA